MNDMSTSLKDKIPFLSPPPTARADLATSVMSFSVLSPLECLSGCPQANRKIQRTPLEKQFPLKGSQATVKRQTK